MKIQTPEGVAGIHRAAQLDEKGVDKAEFDFLYRKLRHPLDAGTCDFGEYLGLIGDELGVDFSDPELIARTEDADVASWSTADDDMVAWLETLSDIEPALLSNIPQTLLVHVRETMPWISKFSPAIFSCDLGLAKPDPDIYRAACDAMGAQPDEVLFLDDTPENVVGARERGLRAVQFLDRATAERDIHDFLQGSDIGRN